MTTAIILAAGAGKRVGGDTPKQFQEVAGRPVLVHTLAAFEACEAVDAIVLVGPEDRLETCAALSRQMGCRKVGAVVAGGAERQDSVRYGLAAVSDETRVVAIHDGARPLVVDEDITRVIEAALETGASVIGRPLTDTIKRVDGDRVEETLDRKDLWGVQTPQAFELGLICEAHERAVSDGFVGTDDTVLVERLGKPVRVVEGNANNVKVTSPKDLARVEDVLSREHVEGTIRIGMGYDVHQLVKGRKLILGGVELPFDRGLLGHSDADVLIHVVIDALLGAVGEGDIGRHFPDTDASYKDVSSLTLLERTAEILRGRQAVIQNVDSTVMAQAPKLAGHITAMESNIADALGLDKDRVSIKATTTEQLGFVGREEGIAAQAVALIIKRKP